MAILRDKKEQGTYIEFSFASCIPGKYEGCWLNFKHYKENMIYEESKIGWTNETIEHYIEVTSKFPLEMQDGFILNNLHMSYEKDLYALEWTKLEGKMYSLHFYDGMRDFTFIVDEDNVRQFGRELEAEWKQGIRLAELAEYWRSRRNS